MASAVILVMVATVLRQQTSVRTDLDAFNCLFVAEEFSTYGLGKGRSEEVMVHRAVVYDLFGDAAYLASKTVFVALHSVVCGVTHCMVDEHAVDGML